MCLYVCVHVQACVHAHVCVCVCACVYCACVHTRSSLCVQVVRVVCQPAELGERMERVCCTAVTAKYIHRSTPAPYPNTKTLSKTICKWEPHIHIKIDLDQFVHNVSSISTVCMYIHM